MNCRECGKGTSFGKPYCDEHVELCDYAARLVEGREKRVAEQEKILLEGPAGVDLEGLLVTDVLNFMENGCVHKLDRIYRLLNIDFDATKSIAERLAAEGLVKRLGLTRRGEGFLVLANKQLV